jgi:teichuronic acid biosynthesis glycosyltransferase TuaG
MNGSAIDVVSIITPAYNASRFIQESVKSVQAQTYSYWELIIVDDCSTDDTIKKIRQEMKLDSRIRLIELEKNSGPAHARNIAINAAKGTYLAFLDCDDLWLPNKLERQLQFMKTNNAAFTYSDYRIMNENGDKSEVVIRVPQKMEYKDLLKNTIIGTLTVMLDKKALGKVQMPLFRDCSEDYGLWLSILSKGICAYGINEELAVYRKCENSLSSNKLKSALKTWNTYRKAEKINVPSSIWYFANYSLHALKKHSRNY